MAEEKVEGYEIPIHRSLTEQILLGGVPRTIAIMNGSIGAALGLGAQSWYVIPICIVTHILAVIATKKDPQFFDCLRRHMKLKSYYST
ncbi:MAG: VirB3 family type IV secretion system protein [Bacteroidota bacterium]